MQWKSRFSEFYPELTVSIQVLMKLVSVANMFITCQTTAIHQLSIQCRNISLPSPPLYTLITFLPFHPGLVS